MRNATVDTSALGEGVCESSSATGISTSTDPVRYGPLYAGKLGKGFSGIGRGVDVVMDAEFKSECGVRRARITPTRHRERERG